MNLFLLTASALWASGALFTLYAKYDVITYFYNSSENGLYYLVSFPLNWYMWWIAKYTRNVSITRRNKWYWYTFDN